MAGDVLLAGRHGGMIGQGCVDQEIRVDRLHVAAGFSERALLLFYAPNLLQHLAFRLILGHRINLLPGNCTQNDFRVCPHNDDISCILEKKSRVFHPAWRSGLALRFVHANAAISRDFEQVSPQHATPSF